MPKIERAQLCQNENIQKIKKEKSVKRYSRKRVSITGIHPQSGNVPSPAYADAL